MKSKVNNYNFFKGTLYVFITKCGGAALAFCCQVLLGKSIGIESYGSLSIFFSIVNVLIVLPLIGMDIGIIRSVAAIDEPSERKWILLTTIKITTIILAVVIAAVITFRNTLFEAIRFKCDSIIYLVFFVAVLSYSRLLDGFLQGEKKTVLTNIISVFANNLIKLTILGIVFIINRTILAAIIVLLSVETILLLIKTLYIMMNYFKIKTISKNKEDVGQYIRYCIPLFFVAFVGVVQLTINKFILGNLMGNYEVGILRICENYSGILSLFVTPFVTMWPIMSEYYKRNKLDKLKGIFSQATIIITTLSLPALITLTICSNEILEIFGVNSSNIVNVRFILFIFFIGTVFDSIIGPAGALLNMTKYSKINLFNNVLLLLLNVSLSFLLIPTLGLLGAAIASSSSMIFINSLNAWQNKRLFNFFPYRKIHIVLIIAGIPIYIFGLMTESILKLGMYFKIVLVGLEVYVCYFVIFVFFYRKNIVKLKNIYK